MSTLVSSTNNLVGPDFLDLEARDAPGVAGFGVDEVAGDSVEAMVSRVFFTARLVSTGTAVAAKSDAIGFSVWADFSRKELFLPLFIAPLAGRCCDSKAALESNEARCVGAGGNGMSQGLLENEERR